MRIEVKGRNIPITDELRDQIQRKFRVVSRQVSPLAELEIEVREERNRAIADCYVAEATLWLKGVTLRASDSSRDLKTSVNEVAEELQRQVKRTRDKRRRRREARTPEAYGDEAGLPA
jgi:putative sigma-54 modulation protein